MPDSFFQSDKKRKRFRAGPSTLKKRPVRREERDEEVSSDAEGDGGTGDLDDVRLRRTDIPLGDEDAINETETAAEKRIRLAKGYLARVRSEIEDGG